MIGFLRAALKRWLMRYFLVDEFCRDCGCRVDLIWTAESATWERYAGANHPPLCMLCFSSRARLAGVLLRWVPVEMICTHGRATIDEGAPGGFNPRFECADCGKPLGPV